MAKKASKVNDPITLHDPTKKLPSRRKFPWPGPKPGESRPGPGGSRPGPDEPMPRLPDGLDIPDLGDWIRRQETTTKRIEQAVNEARKKLLESIMRQIQTGFVFKTAEGDEAFNPNHVQTLIDQAADLLDRANADRHTYEDLAKEYYGTLIESLEALFEDEVIRAELEAGKLEIERALANAEVRAIRSEIIGGKAVQATVKEVGTHLSNSSAYTRAVADSAELGSYPGYYFKSTGSSKEWDRIYLNGTGGFDGSHSSNAYSKAESAEEFRVKSQRLNTDVEAKASETAVDTAKARAALPLKKYAWYAAKERFEAQRIKNWQKFIGLRFEAATKQNGALNFAGRMMALKAQFHQDFRDAMARLQQVSKGLDLIYGYPEYQLPKPKKKPDGERPRGNDGTIFSPIDPFGTTDSLNYFDECHLWTRKAIHWLIRFSQQDQSMIMPVSVRANASGIQTQRFDDQLKDPHDNEVLFGLDPREFLEMRHVRLTGISAVVDQTEDHRNTIWDISVRPPTSAQIFHKGKDTSRKISQILPPVRLGRVLDRSARQDPIVGGTSILLNASPISQVPWGFSPGQKRDRKWIVKIENRIAAPDSGIVLTENIPPEKQKKQPKQTVPIHQGLKDIILFLHIVYTREE